MLGELVGPILKSQQFHDEGTGVHRAEGYLYAVYMDASLKGWRGFAWPTAAANAGQRMFTVDEAETVCESRNEAGYAGLERMPRRDAAPGQTGGCGPAPAGHLWRAWRNKKPRKMN
jgi:hypothetical protein